MWAFSIATFLLQLNSDPQSQMVNLWPLTEKVSNVGSRRDVLSLALGHSGHQPLVHEYLTRGQNFINIVRIWYESQRIL